MRVGRVVPALVFAVLVALLGAGPATAAAEEYPVRADGTIQLEGAGWGHGVGMSQYGAKRGAELGADARGILAAYYPGASLTAAGSQPVRVLLQRWDGAATCTSTLPASTCLEVVAEPGQTVTNLASGGQIPVPASINGVPVASLAVGASSAGVSLWAKAGSWQQVGTAYTGPLEIAAADGVQTARIAGTDRPYRGALRVAWASSTTIQRINVVGLEDYLLGVVPAEMPASWPTAAVQAQGVAARSYAVAAMRSAGTRSYDLCDTTSCQVYGGVGAENATATGKLVSAAPSDVRGTVLTGPHGVISTFFASSNGGWSVSGGSAWLPARADSWDPVSTWTRTVTGACLASKYPGRGAFTKLVVTGRDGNGAYGGRVTSLRLEFTSGSVTVGPGATPMASDSAVRAAMTGCGDTAGLRSSLFRAVGASAPPPPTTPPATPPAAALAPGAGLTGGQSLASASGQFRLSVDAVVAGQHRPGLALGSRTCPDQRLSAASGGTLLMQTDGNLVYYVGGAPVWHTSTWGSAGASARVSDEGAVEVRSAAGALLWSSAAGCTQAFGYDRPDRYSQTGSPAPALLLPGDRMTSPDRRGLLVMQGDGNLVFYRDGAPLWHAGTHGRPGAFTAVQGDGNVVVYSAAGQPLFATMTLWPTAPAGQSNETRLRVDNTRISVQRDLRTTSGGALVSTATGWARP